LTYNVHRCIGMDRRFDPERVARVIEAAGVDLAAVQELDVLEDGVDQARWLADRLGMSMYFVAAREAQGGLYGNALFSKLPLELVKQASLPTFARRESRAAQWVRVDVGGRRLNVVNTHLGLVRAERLRQLDCLLGPEWTERHDCDGATILLGDLNATPRSRELTHGCRGRLRDAASVARRGRARATWPALAPFLRLDHVLASSDLEVDWVGVPSGLARVASDHRPVVAEIIVP
jgi:endonuclease/exonuclease/phosphatase family metal-dependent hydrolase